jgi:hypothetical protein
MVNSSPPGEPTVSPSKNTAKTRPHAGDVRAFIDAIENDVRRRDALTSLELFAEVTGEEPRMWGPSIVGYGSYHYRYASGREGDWMLTGFSPRKQSMTLYIMPGFDAYETLLGRLGKHRTGKSCLYVNRFEDIDLDVLRELIAASVDEMRRRYD